MYSFPEQLDLWNDINKYYSSKIFLIVLNNLVQNVTTRQKTSSNLLLYALATEVKNETILIYQTLSEEKRNGFLNFFLRECLRNNLKAPSEFLVGYSFCLLDAATKVFNSCTVDHYNEICLEYLMGKNSSLPYVLIRVDNIELLQIINQWDCLQNQLTKKFVLCSVIYLSSVRNIDLFEETVSDMLILFSSKFESSVTERCRSQLVSKISTSYVK